MELVARELADPERDCKRFDPGIWGAVARKLADPQRDCIRFDPGNQGAGFQGTSRFRERL